MKPPMHADDSTLVVCWLKPSRSALATEDNLRFIPDAAIHFTVCSVYVEHMLFKV